MEKHQQKIDVPHPTKDGYCCACAYDMAVFEDKLKDQEKAIREELVGKLKAIAVWPEPQSGAGEGMGALAGVGMYMQYDLDRKQHEEQIRALIKDLT